MIRRTVDVMLRKVGNSLVVTIPKRITAKYKLKQGDLLEITLKIDKEK